MRGLKTDKTAAVVIRGHAFVQNLRRGHYELGVEARHPLLRLAAAFDELALVVLKSEVTPGRFDRATSRRDATVPTGPPPPPSPLPSTGSTPTYHHTP